MAGKKEEKASPSEGIQDEKEANVLRAALSEDQLVPIRRKLEQVIKSTEQLAAVHNRSTSLDAIVQAIQAAQDYIAEAEKLSKELPETHVLMGVEGSISLSELRRKFERILSEVRQGRRYVLYKKDFPLAFLRQETSVGVEEIDKKDFARNPGAFAKKVFDERCVLVIPEASVEIAPLPHELVEKKPSPGVIGLRERMRGRKNYRENRKKWDNRWED